MGHMTYILVSWYLPPKIGMDKADATNAKLSTASWLQGFMGKLYIGLVSLFRRELYVPNEDADELSAKRADLHHLVAPIDVLKSQHRCPSLQPRYVCPSYTASNGFGKRAVPLSLPNDVKHRLVAYGG